MGAYLHLGAAAVACALGWLAALSILRYSNPMFAKYFNSKTLAHAALAALPYVAAHLAGMPGVYGVIGSALLQIIALHSAPPAAPPPKS